MLGFAGKQTDQLLAPLLIGDIAGDFRGADDLAEFVRHRRHAQRNIDRTAVLALPHGFEMIDAFTTPDTFQDAALLLQTVLRNQDRDRLADNLFGEVAEQALRAPVPGDDHTVEILADDRIVARFDDRTETALNTFGTLVLADVDQHVHGADQVAGSVVEGRRKRHERHARAVGPLGDRLAAAGPPPLPQPNRHRALVVRQWRAVWAIQAPGAAPPVAVKLRLAAPQRGGGVIVISYPPLGVGHINSRRQQIERLPRLRWVVERQPLVRQGGPKIDFSFG